jgi:hypothetical protein
VSLDDLGPRPPSRGPFGPVARSGQRIGGARHQPRAQCRAIRGAGVGAILRVSEPIEQLRRGVAEIDEHSGPVNGRLGAEWQALAEHGGRAHEVLGVVRALGTRSQRRAQVVEVHRAIGRIGGRAGECGLELARRAVEVAVIVRDVVALVQRGAQVGVERRALRAGCRRLGQRRLVGGDRLVQVLAPAAPPQLPEAQGDRQVVQTRGAIRVSGRRRGDRRAEQLDRVVDVGDRPGHVEAVQQGGRKVALHCGLPRGAGGAIDGAAQVADSPLGVVGDCGEHRAGAEDVAEVGQQLGGRTIARLGVGEGVLEQADRRVEIVTIAPQVEATQERRSQVARVSGTIDVVIGGQLQGRAQVADRLLERRRLPGRVIRVVERIAQRLVALGQLRGRDRRRALNRRTERRDGRVKVRLAMAQLVALAQRGAELHPAGDAVRGVACARGDSRLVHADRIVQRAGLMLALPQHAQRHAEIVEIRPPVGGVGGRQVGRATVELRRRSGVGANRRTTAS